MVKFRGAASDNNDAETKSLLGTVGRLGCQRSMRILVVPTYQLTVPMTVKEPYSTRDDSHSGPFHGTRRIQVAPFFQVPLYSRSFSRGELQLPVLLQDCSAVYCQFVARRERVDRLLQDTPLEPAFAFGSRAMVGLTLFEHHQTTVGPHRAVNLVLPVNRRTGFKRPSAWKEIRMTGDRRHMGFYPLDSALDSPVMLAAGKEVWGYPNFLAQLRMEIRSMHLRVECNDFDGRHGIVRVAGAGFPLMRFPALDQTIFTLTSGELVRSVVNTSGRFAFHLPFFFRLQVGNSSHPMAEHLRFLGLDNARPLAVFSCRDFQARMNEGVTVDVLRS